MNLPVVLLIGVVAVLVFWMVGAYNRLVGLRNGAGSAWQQVDEALNRRGDAVAPLVAALRQGLVGEGAALDALLAGQAQVAAAADALRPRPLRADLAGPLVRADGLMASASARVLALLDLHPDLAADPAVAEPATRLREAGPRLVFARQVFNESVQTYNDAVAMWPTRVLARVFGFDEAGRV